MKKSFFHIFLFILSKPIFGQDNTTLAKVNPITTSDQVFVSKNEVQIQNLHVLAFLGNENKPEKEKKTDKEFVEMCRKNFPNLVEASKFFADRGWEYVAEAELDTAMHRFKLCNLLNNKNIDAYWGAGVICFQNGEFDNASALLKKGIEIDSTNSSIIVDLATVELACYEKNTHLDDLQAAHNHLAKAIDIDPLNILAWLKRSESEYYLENFENAWDCIHSARLLDITKIDLIFVGKLNEKMKDPKNIFKF